MAGFLDGHGREPPGHLPQNEGFQATNLGRIRVLPLQKGQAFFKFGKRILGGAEKDALPGQVFNPQSGARE